MNKTRYFELLRSAFEELPESFSQDTVSELCTLNREQFTTLHDIVTRVNDTLKYEK